MLKNDFVLKSFFLAIMLFKCYKSDIFYTSLCAYKRQILKNKSRVEQIHTGVEKKSVDLIYEQICCEESKDELDEMMDGWESDDEDISLDFSE